MGASRTAAGANARHAVAADDSVPDVRPLQRAPPHDQDQTALRLTETRRGKRRARRPIHFPLTRLPQMEARGIEPRSEHDSDTAPTCVGDAGLVSPPRRLAGLGSNKPLESLASPVEAPGYASPTLRYVSAASGGLPLTQVREAEAYAARASSELAFVVSQLIYQVTENLGTQRYPRQTRRSLSPPKTVDTGS